MADGQKIYQVCPNLVNNAVKFTDYGSVCLEIGSDGDRLCLQSRIPGIGIAEEDIPVFLNVSVKLTFNRPALRRKRTGIGSGQGACFFDERGNFYQQHQKQGHPYRFFA
jgi:K+-sensing histidine kinase KdpD